MKEKNGLKNEKIDERDGEEGEEAESIFDTRRRMKSIYLLFRRANPPKSRRSRHVFTDSKVQRFYNITAIVMMEEVRHLCSLWFYSPRPFTVVTVNSCGMSPSSLDPGLS